MKQSAFIAALKFASHAMAVKDIRVLHLNGVLFEFKGSTLTLVGTDGHRMAYVVLDDDKPDECISAKCTVSCDSVKLLLSAFKAASTGHIDFLFEGDKLVVRGAAQTIPCAIIEGVYPDWRRVCKADAKPVGVESIGVNGDYLANACKAAGAYAGGKFGGMLLKFHGSADAMRIEPTPLPAGCTEAAIIVMPTRT